jgi:hypothetical protein
MSIEQIRCVRVAIVKRLIASRVGGRTVETVKVVYEGHCPDKGLAAQIKALENLPDGMAVSINYQRG